MYRLDFSLENGMFNRIYPFAPRIVKNNLLKSLTQTGMSRAKLQSSRVRPTTFRKASVDLEASKNLKDISNNLCFTNFNLTACFSKEAGRIDHLNSSTSRTNLTSPLPAANDDNRGD